jgi:antitoxin component of MazEF toxin-antitoxin module
MADSAVSKCHKVGRSHFVCIPKSLHDQLLWRNGDFIACRIIGQKLVIARVPLESLAKLSEREAEDITV